MKLQETRMTSVLSYISSNLMTLSNKRIISINMGCIVIYLLVFITYKLKLSQLIFIPILNVVSSFSILLCWIVKQLKIKKHYYEPSELIVLSFEVIILLVSSFAIFTEIIPEWLQIIQFIFYVIHLIVLIIFLVFALTFKMKKLF